MLWISSGAWLRKELLMELLVSTKPSKSKDTIKYGLTLFIYKQKVLGSINFYYINLLLQMTYIEGT